MSDVSQVLELSDVISGLRAELEEAQKKGKDSAIKFGVKEIEIELDLSVAKSLEGTGSGELKVESPENALVKYFIGKLEGTFSLDGKGSYQKVSTQKVKLVLSAENKDGGSTLLSNEEPS